MLTPNTGKKPWRLPEKPEEVDFSGSQPQKAGGRLPGMNSKKIHTRNFFSGSGYRLLKRSYYSKELYFTIKLVVETPVLPVRGSYA